MLVGRYKSIMTRAGNAKVNVTVILDGQILSSAKKAKQQSSEEGTDLVLSGLLKFLQKQMAAHPETIEPADQAQLARIGKLVNGVGTEERK